MIRPAEKFDIPALFEIRTSVRENHLDMGQLAERGVTYDSMAEMLAGDQARTWVAEDDGVVRGFSMADAGDGSVFALFVGPAYEGLGYGRALLAVAEEWLFSKGFDTIWLNTGRETGNRSHSVYRAAGWKMVGPADQGFVRYAKARPG
jgi:GNAT superfamily N-acetyltransferase